MRAGLVKAAHPEIVEPDVAVEPRDNILRRAGLLPRIRELEPQQLHRAVLGHREVVVELDPLGRAAKPVAGRELPSRGCRPAAGNGFPTARRSRCRARRRGRGPRIGTCRAASIRCCWTGAPAQRLRTNSIRSARRPPAPWIDCASTLTPSCRATSQSKPTFEIGISKSPLKT